MILIFAIASGMAWGAQITLAWDPNSEADLVGYKLYIGYYPRNYTQIVTLGRVTQYTITVTDGIPYYFSLTACNAKGYESGFSNIVRYPSYPFQAYLPVVLK